MSFNFKTLHYESNKPITRISFYQVSELSMNTKEPLNSGLENL